MACRTGRLLNGRESICLLTLPLGSSLSKMPGSELIYLLRCSVH